MAVTTGGRPGELSGCWAAWAESDVDNVTRTDMDNGTIKSRRRFTGRIRKAAVSVTLPSDKYQPFVTWFRTNCRAGAIPTKMMTPYGAEEVWAFAEPPTFNWPDKNAFTVEANIYQLDGWV